MDVREILSETMRAVEAAEIPEHLQSVAFSKAFDYISGDVAPRSHAASGDRQPETKRVASDGTAIDQIGKFLGVDTSIVERVFADLNGEIKLIVPVGNIASSRT